MSAPVNLSGVRYARLGLVVGVAVSMAGNIANVVLTHGAAASVGWRIPGAIVWPGCLFIAVEIIVRNRQHQTRTGYLARTILTSVSVTNFVTSYFNLHEFMVKTGEPAVATFTGPFGIDGLILGATLMLLVATLPSSDPLPEPEPIDAPATDLTLVKALSLADVPIADRAEYDEATATVGNARVPRAVRELSDADKKAIEALIDGTPSVDAVAAMNGKSLPTIRKWRQAVTSGRPVKGVSPAVLNYALEVMAR